MLSKKLAAILSLTICLCHLPANAGITKLADELPARVFYLNVGGEMRPVVGVRSVNKIEVLMPGGKRKSADFTSLAYTERNLRPAGRLTLCGMEGTSTSGYNFSGDVLFNLAESNVHMEVVADRPLKNVYAVVTYHGLTRDDQDVITMGKVGDLEAGELIKRDVFLQNVAIPGNTRYHVDFYSNGLPIEVFRINRVVDTAYSKSLLIPWDVRLGGYLEKYKNESLPPKPYHMVITDELLSACRERGVSEVDLVVAIQSNGTLSLKRIDGTVDPAIEEIIRQDIGDWLFFPMVKDGRPEVLDTRIPLRF